MHDQFTLDLEPQVTARDEKMWGGLLSRTRIARLRDAEHPEPDKVCFHAGNLGHMTRLLVQTALPHEDPGDVVWQRSNGNAFLYVQAGRRKVEGAWESIGLPYGILPRLTLLTICSLAVRHRTPAIEFGDHQSEWLRMFGMPDNGLHRQRLEDQMERLFSATVKLGYQNDSIAAQENFTPFRRYLFKRKNKRVNLSAVELDGSFFEELIEHRIPIDLRIVREIRRSPLALDLYLWLTHRVSYLTRRQRISWRALEAQSGAAYSATKDFARKAKKAFDLIQRHWAVRVHWEGIHGAFDILPSEPSVPALSSSRTNRKG